MVSASGVISGPGIAIGGMTKVIQSLYGMGANINNFLDAHIAEMQASDNPTISRSGRVLEMAKYGFGVGYVTPVVVISAGQLLLGNPLAAAGTTLSAATLSNPVAMTCAAIGAIYYGWGALSDDERNDILDRLSHGLEVGIELIKSIIRFVVDKTKELLSSKNLDEIKKFIASAANEFGKTLGDITHKVSDIVTDSVDSLIKTTSMAADSATKMATTAIDGAKNAASKAVKSTQTAVNGLATGRRKRLKSDN